MGHVRMLHRIFTVLLEERWKSRAEIEKVERSSYFWVLHRNSPTDCIEFNDVLQEVSLLYGRPLGWMGGCCDSRGEDSIGECCYHFAIGIAKANRAKGIDQSGVAETLGGSAAYEALNEGSAALRSITR
jgi:hypothetical protein